MKRGGFLLMELLIALLMFTGIVSTSALYYGHTYTLYSDARKRHQALMACVTVIETMRSTRQIIEHTASAPDITITVKDVSPLTQEHLAFLEIVVAWRLTSGQSTAARFTTCIHV